MGEEVQTTTDAAMHITWQTTVDAHHCNANSIAQQRTMCISKSANGR